MPDYSSDYILNQYQYLNSIDWSREPEDDEEEEVINEPNDLDGVLDGMPEED